MMKVLVQQVLLLLGLVVVVVHGSANKNLRAEFIRAMDEATEAEKLQELQQRLLERARPRRDLADAANDDAGNLNITSSGDLNITDYAFKYVGCQNIKSFSDELADTYGSDTVLGLTKFVVFRLCQADKCSNYNKYGCQYNFGEYIIELEYYLQIMAEYHYQQYTQYCATCIACMTPPEGLDDDYTYRVYNETDDSVSFNETVSSDANNTASWNAMDDCAYFDACKNYKKACAKYSDVGDDDNHMDNLLGCQQFAVGDVVGYLGPHCADDGYSITVGIFKDDECKEYSGSQQLIASYTGSNVDDSWLKFYSNPSCVSCTNQDTYSLYNDDVTAQGAYAMCEVLYEASGKCNRYMNVKSVSGTYDSKQQEQNELQTCTYIESLMENNYDEFGEIMLGHFNTSNWNSLGEYTKAVRSILPRQVVGLVISLSLMLGLLGYSIFLYAKIKRIHTARQKSYVPGGAYSTKRLSSGITMNRSESGFSAREASSAFA